MNNYIHIYAGNRKSASTELTGFKSLCLAKFQAFTLDERHHLLVKRFLRKPLWKSRCCCI